MKKDIIVFADCGTPHKTTAYSKLCNEMLIEAKERYIKENGGDYVPSEFGLQKYITSNGEEFWECGFSDEYTGLTNWLSNEQAFDIFSSCDCSSIEWESDFDLECEIETTYDKFDSVLEPIDMPSEFKGKAFLMGKVYFPPKEELTK